MIKGKTILVTGAGGFIGGYLVRDLSEHNRVVATDIKPLQDWVQTTESTSVVNRPKIDLRVADQARSLFRGEKVDYAFALATDIGGMAYITTHFADLMYNNSLCNINTLQSSVEHGVSRYFFSSSACAYPWTLQEELNSPPLKESHVLPANPDSLYGWEKLYTEKLLEGYEKTYGLETRAARFHSIYGEGCDFSADRGKAPSALIRKAIDAEDGGKIEIWGDGKQQRTFLYISDCVDGILKITEGPYNHPFNLGTKEVVSIDELADIVIKLSGKTLGRWYNPDMPRGVNCRSADRTLALEQLGWEPKVPIEEGMRRLYAHISSTYKGRAVAPRAETAAA